MLFSKQYKNDRWSVLGGCAAVSAILALAIAFCGSFNLGWFTPASLTLLWQSFLGLLFLCVSLSVIGCSDFFDNVIWLPISVIAMAFSMDGEEKEEAY